MAWILLSIIITLGGAQGPSGDFNDDTNTNDGAVTTTQSVKRPAQHK